MKKVHYCTTCKNLCLDTDKHKDHKVYQMRLLRITSFLILLVVVASYMLKFKKILIDFIFTMVLGYLVIKLGKEESEQQEQ